MAAFILFVTLLAASPPGEPPAGGEVLQYMVGDGWGCALVGRDRQGAWDCWETAAPGPTAPLASLPAWRAPLPVGGRLVGGPDRICRVVDEEVRCFHPPRRGEPALRPFGPPAPPRATGAEPSRPPPQTFLDISALYPGLVGGTFACPSKHNDLWCAGDDSFGQLGDRGAGGAPPSLLKLWITENVGLGTWHGCAWKDGGPPRLQGLFCWGRGDYGQLGVAAPDVCRVDGKDVACARRPIRVPIDFRLPGLGYAPNRGRGDLRGGDLFTCARRGSGPSPGIVCWGASRDGLFGAPSLCPAGLAAAWPLRGGGTVAAPAAACSPTPAVIAGSDRFKRFLGPLSGGKPTRPAEVTDAFDVGPRGICMISEAGELWCKGAIPTPGGLTAQEVVVSPGDQASACALTREGRLFCWGEGYSPATAPDRPVAITFEPPPPPPVNPNPAPIDTPAGQSAWGESCSVHRPCRVVARTVPTCPAGARAITPEAAAALPAAGATVSVRGPLRAGGCSTTLVACSELDPVSRKPRTDVRACCNGVSCEIVVGDEGGKIIPLDGVGCVGDESRVCCGVVARGQTVIVTGTLVPNKEAPWDGSPYRLDDARICTPRGATEK